MSSTTITNFVRAIEDTACIRESQPFEASQHLSNLKLRVRTEDSCLSGTETKLKSSRVKMCLLNPKCSCSNSEFEARPSSSSEKHLAEMFLLLS